MRGVVLASLLAAARGAASWNETYVDGLLHAGAVAKVEGLLPASSFRLDALVAALGDAAWAEPLVHLSSERGAQAALGSYADVAAAVAAGDASAVLRLEARGARRRGRRGPRRRRPRLSGTKEWLVCAEPPRSPFEDAEAKLDRCASYDDVEMAGRACETLTLGPGDALAIPPRTVHSARAVGGESVHLTLQRAGARPACGDVDEEAGYGAALRAAGARDALVAMADAGVFPPDVAPRTRTPRRSDGLAEFAIGDDDVADAWRRAARAQGWAGLDALAAPATLTRVAVERGALADVAVDGASRGAADDFFAAVAAAAPAASGPLAAARARQGATALSRRSPSTTAPSSVTLAASGAVTGAATVTSAAGSDVALARRRALQTTTWRVGNACAVGTYGSGYECASCNEECDVQHWSGAYYEYSCDSGCTSCASCPECEPGTYQPYTAQTYCYSCPTGTYAPSNGLTACTVCEVGKYAMAAGSCACTLCEPGTYAPATETVLCTECEAGRYQSAFGATTCYDCPEGFFCPTQADGATACPAGKYSGANAEDCISCPDGYYSDADCDGDDADACSGGITSCEPCAAGTYPSTSNAYCISCDAGTYSPGGQETCTECPAGAYCGTGSSSYTICEAGKYAISGSSSCSSCAAGRFLADDGATLEAHDTGNDCVVCDAGRYSASSASGSCAACAEGTFLWDETLLDELLHDNANDCSSCPEGTYSGAGASSCAACDAGTFAAGEGNSACEVCAAGSYVVEAQQGACLPCAAGKYNDDAGTDASNHDESADCLSCDAGKFSEDAGSTACDDCAAGTFASGVGNSDCNVCYAGTYSLGAAATCAHCPAQTSLADEGTAASAHDSEDDCLGCGEGLWCASGGCHECTDCELCTNENHEPTFAVGDATLDLGAVDENGGFAIIGELGASDIENDYLDYVITAGDDAGLFSAANNILYVVADAGLDFETATSYTLTIEATEAYTTEQPSSSRARTSGPYGDAAGVDVTMTYGNGADGATYYAYGCSVTTPGTEITCSTDEGVGALHSWTVTIAAPGATTWTATGAFTTSYAAPTLASVTTTADLATAGGEAVALGGSEFGPRCDSYCGEGEKPCGGACVETSATCASAPADDALCGAWLADTVRVFYAADADDLGSSWACASVDVSSSDGGRAHDLHDATVSYAAPSISGIATADGTAITMLPTIGGTTMVVAGANFGAADDLASVSVDMHANQGDGDGWVDLEDCAITVDHTEITCVLPERGGVDYHWRATRAGLTSDASTVLTKYAPPTVTGVSGALTISSTAGGATIYVHGDNFGLTWMESSFTYGPLPDADLYSGTCSVTVKHERAACTTGPGTGSGHALKFTLWGQESVVFDAGVGYGTPYITFYENFYSSDPDRDGFLTAGGEKIVVHGGNFGADDSKIDAVTFGPSGYEYQTCDVDGAYGAPGCGCVVALDHEALECNTTAAVGMNHQWKVIIDGQHSTTPSTKTQPPSVDAIVIVGNESVAAVAAVGGGEVVRILGANFGAEQDKVEGVTSEPGGVLSYAAPEIFAIAPAAAETAGGALLVINGTNLGLDYYMSYLEVLVDGAVVALDGAELTRATPGSSGYTYACGDGLECVALVAPPMGDAVHTRAVSVRVGSTEHPSIVLSSGEVSYEYDGPVITSLSTADGDTFGTVKCEILGHNFGASANLGSVYVNGAKIPAAQISEYGHNRIVLLYLGGVTGVLYVELGAKASDEMSFEIRSPRLVTEDSRFKPDADGYRTTGTTADGDQRFVTVAGYHFSGSMEVWVGAEEVLDGNGDQRFGVQAEIVGDLEEVDDIITVFSGGYPSYVGNTSADALYINYLPPSIDSVSATLVGTAGGDELALAGDNFGPAEDAVAIEPYAYAAPVVASSSPDEAATEGGVAMTIAGLVVSSYATDAIELLSPEGEASGPMTVVVAACGSVDDPDSCVASGEAVTFTFSPPKIYYVAVEAFDGSLLRPFAGCYVPEGETEEVCVDASCDRTAACKGATLDGCDLRTRGGAEVVLYGANFGLSLPTIVFDGAPVDAELVSHDAGHSTHALVKFVLPAGSGRDLDVVVEAGGTASAAAAFAYDPPCVTSVYPNAPDASGSVLNINGHNFGETDDAAGNVSIVIGGLECGPVVVGATTLPAWQTDGGNAYLYCATPRLTVGVKDVNITAAGQSVYYAESEAMISFSCANDHYGQVADQVYVEADGSCHEECVEDDARACAVVHLPDGNVKNCTVLTREDEYCLECPLGSMCDAWTTVYPIEPYAESGYYRLDLGDAEEYDVSCDAFREHRPFYCYDFSPCSPADACVGANECAEGYTQTKCSKCCDVSRSRNADGSKNPECWNDAKTEEMLYYRAYGECVECPTSQAWLIALLVLSVFAGTEIAWPRVLRDFYRNLAVINLDFLDIFPPECSLAMSYEQSWLAVEFAPLILAAACYLVFLVVYTYQVCANAHNRREMKKKLARLRGQLTSALLYGFYFVYLYIAENTLDSKETRSLIYDDQLLRYMHKGGHEEGLSPYLATVAKTRAKLGLLYYRFKPDMPYWIVVVVLRKMCLAITTIMFHSSASFQLATLLLILFSSLVLQMRHLPYSSPALGTDAHPKVTNVSAKFVFEYNTVEGLLLSCSVLICLFGVMLDSDYLEDGKHKSVREAITILTLFIISVSLAYFGAVIWHEIVSELFPSKERASTFDKNIELAEGNFNRRAARPEKVQDADLMSVEEQLQMKALLAKMQDENRALKKDLAAASKDDAKTATKVVKKKKGFANVFSSSSKTVAHRGSAAMDGASGFSKDASEQIATPTAASNPMMFKKPSATTPKPPKPAPASPKPPPAPTP
ncbi:calcium ion binding protein [Aureococcus anophagefferens]|nr:calcium ion binding protein [Aureococcus anophagefferens]